MCEMVMEVQELAEIRDNVRRHVEALELCWSCQKISECQPAVVDDGGAVWLCPTCWEQVQLRRKATPGALIWPSV